jgi:hypothetical protein
MADNEEIGLVKINYNVFLNCLRSHNSNVISENIVNKANELVNTYNCFVSNYDARSLWEKKKIIASNKIKTTTRHHIINIDFSDSSKCKKEFISYLNKLTDVNKSVIYDKIKYYISQIDDNIINSLFDVLINFIKNSNNIIYIEVLFLFNDAYIESHITNYYSSYLENKEWLPQEIIIPHNEIFDDEFYDVYCNYIKLKKNCLSILRALCIILKKINKISIIENIINEIIKDLKIYLAETKNNYKHIIELLLEEYTIILDYIPKQTYINYITNIDLSNLDASTKFKISNITEKYI